MLRCPEDILREAPIDQFGFCDNLIVGYCILIHPTRGNPVSHVRITARLVLVSALGHIFCSEDPNSSLSANKVQVHMELTRSHRRGELPITTVMAPMLDGLGTYQAAIY